MTRMGSSSSPIGRLESGKWTRSAPLTAAGLFPGGELRLDGGTYKKGPLAATGDCAAAAGVTDWHAHTALGDARATAALFAHYGLPYQPGANGERQLARR